MEDSQDIMKLQDFQYELPEGLIAQQPAGKRTGSRLMVLNRDMGTIEHRKFEDLTEYLRKGDCMVLNNTRVIPARLLGVRPGSIARVEFLLLEKKSPTAWEVMVSPGRKARPGDRVVFGGGILEASVVSVLKGGTRLVEFKFEGSDFDGLLDKCGQIPLPPYIKSADVDVARYQTVYSKYDGSVAAPTAGLHFTSDYLEAIRDIGVKTAFITLHVGAGTFKPVKCEDIEEHKMHSERYFIDEEAANDINRAKGIGVTFGEGHISSKGAGEGNGGGNAGGNFEGRGGGNVERRGEGNAEGNAERNAEGNSGGNGEGNGRGNAGGNEGGNGEGNGGENGEGNGKGNCERYGGGSVERCVESNGGGNGGGRVIAVGTTSLRSIEAASDQHGFLSPCEGRTDIFIYPGYKFKCADALLTNFHLPGSTLIMLVCAFAGYEFTMKAYMEAVEMQYRFFSFGDAMLIL